MAIDQVLLNASTGSQSSGRIADEDLYYYGTDPVVQVDITGELLLLTSWQRGSWDGENNKWSEEFPPLMPLEVLQSLNDTASDAIRDEDRRRLSERFGQGDRKSGSNGRR